ncbi:MAG: InlB B-repeat-containing protein [Clostridia bacterium]|nr:InlB B-repeat-containing protein [Clostridia bacterium]
MKKITLVLLSLLLLVAMLLTSCADDVQDVIDNNTKTPLAVPTNVRVDEDTATLMWNSVEYAGGYTVLVNETTYTTSTNSFSLQGLKSGEYTISVKANGDGTMYVSSAYSDTITYTRVTNSGNEYEDDVVAAFKEFDEINTKNSFLGYGIDIINASAITSKNVLMTYPIFDMDKLMNEKLLKSNEHYNSFESIEASTIEEFSQNMSNSTSITSGQNVSAKGNIYGVDVKASAALSSGLTTSFTKTSDLVESQYFLEVIAENQSYWLVLQTSELRYKELLSEEFKSDLYNTSITPAQLFEKYGTHLLTSVAMGGNICMYYTMYSYDKTVTTSQYAEISSTLKTNVEAAYGGYSAGAGTENSFSNTFTYETMAHSYGIQIDKKIVSAGGGSFGINNETTLYENYYDWQKSLDTYPVVIGIKDVNSLYPIWNLLDLNVEGAAERYNELYNYFQSYGAQSYDNLCKTYSITPSVAPTDITGINVGSHTNYSENQTVNVSSGETLRISFDVEPYNANKYLKTYSVDNDALASIDDTGLLTISTSAPGGSYIRVTITAGSVSKQITLYVINTYNVSFNTRVGDLTVPPIYGILEGYTIDEPVLYREGYILEGWYTDAANTTKFNFETDSVTSNMTLFAKWVAIKPVVTFDTGDGSKVESQTLAYNGTATKPKNPTLTGYTFGGWYTDEEYTEPFDFTTTVISDITLHAKWAKIEYTVSFVTDGGTPIAPITTSITEEYKISEPITVKQYYALAGWYKDASLTQRFYFESEITSDITLYAKWTPVKVTVNLVDSDGTSPVYDILGDVINARTTDIDKEFKITVPEPVKEGYTFAGWYLDGILIDLETYSDFRPGDTYTLVARWTVNSYTITFDTVGGTYISPITQNYGTKIVAPADPAKEGYTFIGWNASVPDSMPAENMTLTAIWSVNSYTITFDTVGGSDINPITQDYATAIVSPADPTREGYTFVGWDVIIPSAMPAKNLVITAKWTVNSYTASFIIDGEEYLTETYNYGDEIIYPEVNIEGHTFSGWKYGLKALPTTMPSQNIELTGTLTVNRYNLKYYVDGELYSTKTYSYGEAIALIDEPTEDGKKFSGWICSSMETIPSVMPARDIRIDGSFDQTTYYVRYYVDDVLVKTQPIIKGHGITPYTPDVKEGYSFSGWLVKDGDAYSLMPEVMPAVDISAYGSYTINQYTITFDTAGGTEIDAITADYGTIVTKPANPTREGYTFAGWDVAIPSAMPAGNMTITAKWTVNQYTITFNTMGGTKIDAITADYGTAIAKPADPTREGYTFAGWDVAIPTTMPIGDMTITALWAINRCTITFDTDGGTSIDAITADYGAAITKPANPTREGYTFAGWDVAIPATMPAGNMIVTAKWTVNQYTITFNTMGGTKVNAITSNYGTAITKPADPTREGYTFAGWDVAIPTTMPAGDMTITASWTINRCTITFDTDGGTEIDAITADYGTVITKPSNPAREGYTFAGWDVAIPATMPAADMTVTAKWTLNTSSVTYNINAGATVDGQSTKGSFAINGSISTVSYNVTQLSYAYSTTYNEYYNFLGWYTSATGGVQLTDGHGTLLANVSGFTNANGKWIRENSAPITLYAHWEQTYTEHTYIEDAEDFYTIFADGNALSGTYMLIDDISLDNHTPIGTYYWAHDNADKADEKAVITPFTGVLNGDGHKITYSMTFDSFVQYSNYALGLFATSDGATFEYIDLDIQLIAKGTPGHDTREVSVGGLVGMAKNTTFRGIEVLSTSRIENNETDQFWKDIIGTWRDLGATYAGGVVGDARSCNFFDCTNGGTVYAQGWTAYAGGIAGNSYNGYNTGCSNLEGSSVSAHGGEHENYGNEHSDEGVVFGKETAPWLRKDNSTVLNY